MVLCSPRSLCGLAIGYNVAVPVSQFDMRKCDPQNLTGVVSKTDHNDYTIENLSGIRPTLTGNQVKFVKCSGLTADDVRSEHNTVCEIVRKQSICWGVRICLMSRSYKLFDYNVLMLEQKVSDATVPAKSISLVIMWSNK